MALYRDPVDAAASALSLRGRSRCICHNGARRPDDVTAAAAATVDDDDDDVSGGVILSIHQTLQLALRRPVAYLPRRALPSPRPSTPRRRQHPWRCRRLARGSPTGFPGSPDRRRLQLSGSHPHVVMQEGTYSVLTRIRLNVTESYCGSLALMPGMAEMPTIKI